MQKSQLIAEQKFNVLLTAADGKKVDIIQAVKDATGLSLIESKSVVENLPAVLREKLPKAEAETLEKALEAAGAAVEIKPVQ
ncbi:ribosomal protein L7/L12 [Grimontia kaedaensis]|nr:ribosomal protein L7/L12 [Grimontia kaedaensis]